MKRNPIKRKASNDAWLNRNRHKQRATTNRYYANNKEKVLKKQRETRVKNPKVHLLKNARNRAAKYGLLFDIDENDFDMPFTCPLLGYVLMPAIGVQAPNSPSLDRKDPKKGYIKGNVWVISYRANMAKSDLTLEELQMLVMNLTVHQR